MDPDAALLTCRTLSRKALDDHDDFDDVGDAAVLAEAFEALDGWLSAGGFLPTDWSARSGARNRPL